MRLDTYLTLVRLVKTRSLAKALIDAGRVSKAGHKLKAGCVVHVGDEFVIHYDTRYLDVRVLGVPEGRHKLPSARRGTMYAVLSTRPDEFFD